MREEVRGRGEKEGKCCERGGNKGRRGDGDEKRRKNAAKEGEMKEERGGTGRKG
jgi:hypothetical protein